MLVVLPVTESQAWATDTCSYGWNRGQTVPSDSPSQLKSHAYCCKSFPGVDDHSVMLVQGVHPGYTTRSLPELPNARCILDRLKITVLPP